ncbi:MAG: hypothetical protein IJV53_01230 [Aeriscardovia sp.]|nr:hypothetical protein [Aeriscardovia sp.]
MSLNTFDDDFSDDDINDALSEYIDDFKDLDDEAKQLDDLEDLRQEVNKSDSFATQLDEILGEKAKSALLLSPFQDGKLLAAFCAVADIQASCISSNTGSVAFLKDCDGQQPEKSAQSLTEMVAGLSVILITNRADKLSAYIWDDGKQGESCVPPLLFMQVDDYVEDYMIGALDLTTLNQIGSPIYQSSDYTKEQAFEIIQHYTGY